MQELLYLYSIVREAGQFAPFVVLAILLFLRKNDLKHINEGIERLEDSQAETRKDFKKHLVWHAEKDN